MATERSGNAPLQKLKRSVWVHFQTDNEQARIFCSRCEQKFISDPEDEHFSEPQECLVIRGSLLGRNDPIPNVLTMKATIILPIMFVTYIGLGPEIQHAEEGSSDTIIVCPSPPGAPNRMTSEKIAATLAEFYDPAD